MLRYLSFSLLLLTLSCDFSRGDETFRADDLKINQIQVLGSHNSFKQAIHPLLLQVIAERDSDLAISLDYDHAPLEDQLDLGLRQLELDLYYDPQGGRFANPLGRKLLEERGISLGAYDRNKVLDIPGFKVLHIQDIDFRSHRLLFQDCLLALLQWSEDHPAHLPILININPRIPTPELKGFDFVPALPLTAKALDSLDLEIKEVMPLEKIISPEDVTGNYGSLEAATLDKNWPRIGESRGKFMFILDAAPQGDIIKTYLEGHPSLKGRLLFVNSRPGSKHAAFVVMNDPLTQEKSIREMARLGYLIRTRADADTHEARRGDLSRFKAALRSGAHFISTDYYLPDPRFEFKYQINLPGAATFRCHPFLASTACDSLDLE